MANTGDLVRNMTAQLDSYDISGACDELRSYLDMLTNWYVRRSRQRFFDENVDAFDALYTALETVSRVAASLLPLVSEEIWRGLTGGRSVHLADWPDADLFPANPELVEAMDRVQQICSTGSSLRKAANLRVRLPLQELTVVAPGADALEGFAAVVADELNLRSVRLLDADSASPEEFGIEQKLVVNARAAGPRLGKNVQQAIKGSKSGDWSVDDAGVVTAGGLELEPQEYTLETVVAEAAEGAGSRAAAVLPGGGFVVLNTEVTPELEAEGAARDMVRAIQQARKDAGLNVSDRIRTTVTATAGRRRRPAGQRGARQDRNPDHRAGNGCGRRQGTPGQRCQDRCRKSRGLIHDRRILRRKRLRRTAGPGAGKQDGAAAGPAAPGHGHPGGAEQGVPDHPRHRHQRQDLHGPHDRGRAARPRAEHRAVHEPAPVQGHRTDQHRRRPGAG